MENPKNRCVLSLLCILFASQAWAQEVQFRIRATQPNDVSHQTVQCDLQAERTIRQQNQVVDTSKQTLNRKQDRTLTILAVNDGKPTRAKIVYGNSATHVRADDNQSVEATQPVAGNTYLITRNGEELTLTDEKGKGVTHEEEKILRMQMETFGKPNPLAAFLNGKRIAVGQAIEVPDAVAAELLGLTGNQGKTDKLSLRLVAQKTIDRANCAVFETLLRSSSSDTSMSLLMKGELLIEINTCRTRSIRLHGPVAISETRGPVVGRFIVSTNGTLQLAVQNSFDRNRVADLRKSFVR